MATRKFFKWLTWSDVTQIKFSKAGDGRWLHRQYYFQSSDHQALNFGTSRELIKNQSTFKMKIVHFAYAVNDSVASFASGCQQPKSKIDFWWYLALTKSCNHDSHRWMQTWNWVAEHTHSQKTGLINVKIWARDYCVLQCLDKTLVTWHETRHKRHHLSLLPFSSSHRFSSWWLSFALLPTSHWLIHTPA